MLEMLAAALAVATAELVDGRGRRRPAHFFAADEVDERIGSTEVVSLLAAAAAAAVVVDDDGGPAPAVEDDGSTARTAEVTVAGGMVADDDP